MTDVHHGQVLANLLEITVIIPTYNGARFIAEAIRSVCDQTIPAKEIIVVDDCSIDDTVSRVSDIGRDSRIPIRTISLPKNSGGPAHPINVAVAAATTELVAVLDQDDVYASDILELVTKAFSAATGCSMAFYWRGDVTDPNGAPTQSPSLRSEIVALGVQQDGFWKLPANSLTPHIISAGMFVYGYPGFVFRKSLWSLKGGVDESLRIASDMDFFHYLSQQGEIALIPRVGYLRRDHDSNVSNNTSLMFYEIGLVTGRTVTPTGRQPQDAKLIKLATDKILDLAYWFREAHYYSQSADLYRLAGRISNRRLVTFVSLLRLLMHRTVARALRRDPILCRYTENRIPTATN